MTGEPGFPSDPVLMLTNPGSRRAAQVGRRIESRLLDHPEAQRIHIREVFSSPESPGPVERVVIVGGDGTINLALKWLERARIDSKIAIVPAGTGNNLAGGLGIPTDTDEAIELAFRGDEIRSIDCVSVLQDDRSRGTLLQVGALGLPARVAARFDRLRHVPIIRHPVRWLGNSIYRLLALLTLTRSLNRKFTWKLEIDGETLELSGAALFLGNEGTIGGGFCPCPRAQIDDGRIDLCLLPTLPLAGALRLFREVSSGTHLNGDVEIYYRQCQKVRILQQPSPLLIDGDIVGTPETVEVEVLAEKLDIVLGHRPAGRS